MAHRYSITNLPILLERGDTVTFDLGRKVIYHVENEYLWHRVSRYRCDNAWIFRKLGFTVSDVGAAYGYTPAGGDWPTCQQYDYAALTRLVLALFQEITFRRTGVRPIPAGVSTRDIVRLDAGMFLHSPESALKPEMKKFYSLLVRRGILEKKTFKVLDKAGLDFLGFKMRESILILHELGDSIF